MKVGPDTTIKWQLHLLTDSGQVSIPVAKDSIPAEVHQLAKDLSDTTRLRVTVVSTTITQTTYGE